MTPNQEPMERWQGGVKEYLQHAFARHIQHGMDDIKKNPKWKLNNECTDWAIGELDKAMEVFNKEISHQKALSRAEVLEEIRGKLKGLDCSFCNYESEVKLRLDELEEKV
jgi:hypothetical protein